MTIPNGLHPHLLQADPLIFTCRTGNHTKAVSQFLSDQAGYVKVFNAKTGIAAWAKDGRMLATVFRNLAKCSNTENC
ncbi:MAG: rhodanese-like domain-containing protein [Sterolibacterium sp.]